MSIAGAVPFSLLLLLALAVIGLISADLGARLDPDAARSGADESPLHPHHGRHGSGRTRGLTQGGER